MEYPTWIEDKRTFEIKNRTVRMEPSERRVEDRKAVYEIFQQKLGFKDTVDTIIDYFRTKYEGEQWHGLSKKARRTLWHEQKGVCFHCKKPVSLHGFTVEHIVSRASGGGNEWENLAVAHPQCNFDYGNGIADPMGYYKESPARELTGMS